MFVDTVPTIIVEFRFDIYSEKKKKTFINIDSDVS